MPKQRINDPKWRKGWTDKKTGRPKKGHWYITISRRHINLTARWDAPDVESGRGIAQAVKDAQHRAIAYYRAQEASNYRNAKVRARHKVTVAEVYQAYLIEQVPTLSEYRQNEVKRLLKEFVHGNDVGRIGKGAPFLGYGNLAVEDFTHRDMDVWRSKHPAWNQQTWFCRGNIVKTMLNFAVASGIIETSPLQKYTIRHGSPRTAYFSDEELQRLLEHSEPNFRFLCEGMVELGSRPGELARLQRQHVHRWPNGHPYWCLGVNEWKCGKKTGKPRRIPLSRKWMEWTEQRLKEIGPNDFLFATKRGTPWNRNSWSARFRDAAKAAGIRRELVMYSLRHTWVTQGLAAGATEAQLAAAGGTSSDLIKQTYGHLADEYLELQSVQDRIAGAKRRRSQRESGDSAPGPSA